jgi:hypothetical protein
MYYVKINDSQENQLSYYCRNCGHQDTDVEHDSVCILNTQMKKGKQHFEHIVNKYTKLDPTLPRIYNLPCPSKDCLTNAKENVPREVLYMRYDDNNLKYLYMCCVCDTIWNQ